MKVFGYFTGWNDDGEPVEAPYPEVRNCPNCGAIAGFDELGADDAVYIMCTKCGYSLDTSYYDTYEDAAKVWNNRPLEDALRAENAELQADYAECTDSRIQFLNEATALRAEVAELRAEVAELRAFKNSVPWEAIVDAANDAFVSGRDDIDAPLSAFLVANMPEPDK